MSNYRADDNYPRSQGGRYSKSGYGKQNDRQGGYSNDRRGGYQSGQQGRRGYQNRGYDNRNQGRDDRRFEPREFTRRTGTDQDLISRLHDLDGRNYGAYKSVIGDYDYGDFKLHVDRIQSDPYAPPSQLRATANPADMGIPADLLETADQRLAVADFLAREFATYSKPTEEIRIARSGQEILQRSYATVSPTHVELRFQCQFPARGRTILGHAMARLADVDIPYAVMDTFDFVSEDATEHLDDLRRHVQTYVDYRALQKELVNRGWIGFVADGAVLARRSGVSDLPLTDATAFTSPDSLRETVTLPHAGQVSGMALKPGVTVIVGGGYHGKSTLLNALQRGVYPHVPKDGRELVALVPDAMKVRAADGRAVTGVDVSAFINGLPGGGSTTQFSTENASGSTSQAASIVEALEVGVPVLLIDEDTSATNLMIRDERMRALVHADKEPITPFVDRIAGLARAGVSTILVMGGSGDYLDVADLVLMMDNYECVDVTSQAREVVADRPRNRCDEDAFPPVRPRFPLPGKRHGGRAKTKSRGLDQISLDRQDIDVSDVEQIVDAGQTESIAWSIRTLLDSSHANSFDGSISLADALVRLDGVMDNHGLDGLGSGDKPAFLVRPRRVDVAAALNRFRSLRVAAEPKPVEFSGEDVAASVASSTSSMSSPTGNSSDSGTSPQSPAGSVASGTSPAGSGTPGTSPAGSGTPGTSPAGSGTPGTSPSDSPAASGTSPAAAEFSPYLSHPRVARLQQAIRDLGFTPELDYLDSEDGPVLFARPTDAETAPTAGASSTAATPSSSRFMVAALADANECNQIDALIAEDDIDAGDHPVGEGGFLSHWVRLQVEENR